jgi:hypothetical protein
VARDAPRLGRTEADDAAVWSSSGYLVTEALYGVDNITYFPAVLDSCNASDPD